MCRPFDMEDLDYQAKQVLDALVVASVVHYAEELVRLQTDSKKNLPHGNARKVRTKRVDSMQKVVINLNE